MGVPPRLTNDERVTCVAGPAMPMDGGNRNVHSRGTDRVNSAARGNHVARYVVIEEIGRGGMGVVLRAYDPRLQREVAIKLLHADDLGAEAQLRMLREAQAMAQLAHPNVVAIYDAEVAGESVVLAMEYVRGMTLAAWLSSPRPWRETVRVFAAAGRGLAAAHAVGLLHRDFKPTNALVGEDGRVRVTDFGLARAHQPGAEEDSVASHDAASDTASRSGELTELGTILGTPRYMAPEQHEGGPLGPAADQYAFCVALWEGLTGAPPFEGMTALGERKRQGPPPWPRDIALPAPIREAIQRGLAPDPSERWSTMDALLDALAHEPGQLRRTWALASLSIVAIAAGVAGWAAHQERLAGRCSGAAAQLTEAWGEHRRASARDAFSATSAPYAQDAWNKVASQLDGYADAWAAMHTDACQATTVRGEQPATVMDLRMACLHRAKVKLHAVAEVLSQADARVVEKAQTIVQALPSLDGCADVEALAADVTHPSDAEREAVEAAQVELAHLQALAAAGKHPEVLTRVQSLLEQTQRLTYGPLRANLMTTLGLAKAQAGNYPESEAALREALRAALSSRKWSEAASVAAHLVEIVGWLQARPHEGLTYAQTGQALAALAEDETRAVLHTGIGNTLQMLGLYAEAESEHRQAVALGEKLENPILLATAREHLGRNLSFRGKHPEAEAQQRASLALREETLGPEHPDVALALCFFGGTLLIQGRPEEAEAQYRRALAIWERALGPDDVYTAAARAAIGKALTTQGRRKEAIVELQAALRVQREVLGPEYDITMDTQALLAVSLGALGQHEEAVTLMRAVLASYEKTFAPDHTDLAGERTRMAQTLSQAGRYEEAEIHARRAVEAYAKTSGFEHPGMPIAHAELGVALLGQGRHVEAEVEFRSASVLAQRLMSPTHPAVARYVSDIGTALEAQARYEEAEHEHRRALSLLEEVHGAVASQRAITRGRLASALRAQRRHEEARALYEAALEHRAALPVQQVLELELGLGRTLLESGRIDASLQVFERAWAAAEADTTVAASVRARLGRGFARALAAAGGESSRKRALLSEVNRLVKLISEEERRLVEEIEDWAAPRSSAANPSG